MRIYLDDDSGAKYLVRLLKSEGHDVQTTIDASMHGRPDPIHMAYAVRSQRVLLTANRLDFEMLHDLIILSGGHHPGVLVVCKENDRRRDMSPHAIAQAVKNLIAAGIDPQDQFQSLNHWR